MDKIKLNITQYKILKTIGLLNDDNLYPLPLGVYKILKGVDDMEMNDYKSLLTYKTLISITSKKVTLMITLLCRYHYIEKFYDVNTDEMYLRLSALGKSSIFDFEKNHKVNLDKKEVTNKKTIIKID